VLQQVKDLKDGKGCCCDCIEGNCVDVTELGSQVPGSVFKPGSAPGVRFPSVNVTGSTSAPLTREGLLVATGLTSQYPFGPTSTPTPVQVPSSPFFVEVVIRSIPPSDKVPVNDGLRGRRVLWKVRASSAYSGVGSGEGIGAGVGA